MQAIFHVAILILLVFSPLARAQTPGVSDSEITVGQFAAMSGPAAELGQRLQVGILSFFNAVNAQGGVGGRTIKLVTRDDGYEPDKAVSALKALINEDKVFSLIGSVGTPTGLAALPVITENRVPIVGMFTGAQALRSPFNRYVFHVRAGYNDETERIVQYLTTLGTQKVAVFYQNDAYGKAGLDGVTAALTKRGLKPTATATVERNTVEVSQAIKTILAAEPQVIVQIGAYKACAAFIQEARKQGYKGQFFNVSFVGSKALADELGKAGAGVAISQVVPFPFMTSSPLVREYQQRMQESGQKEFDFSSMEGYVMAKVFVEGIKRAGKTLTRETLITGLESMRDVNLGGFTINFSPTNHEGSKFTDLTLIDREGRFVH
jgi:ABC-type branched-subunit amino acid transport system substrate-binding protein